MVFTVNYRDLERLFHYFEIRKKDKENMQFLGKILLPYEEEFAEAFYNNLMKFEYIKEYLPESKLQNLKKTIKIWYRKLFSGKYDSEYLLYLLRIAKVHAEESIPPHYVIVAMNFVGRFCTRRVAKYFSERAHKFFDQYKNGERKFCDSSQKELIEDFILDEVFERMEDLNRSLRKFLALNEDILVSYYVDSELRTFMNATKIERLIISFSKKFAIFMDIAILLGLMFLAVFVIGLFGMDISHIFHGDLAHGLIAALGDLLILWTVLELLNSEIRFMLGGELAVSAFVSVALAATIREALVVSLEHDKPIEFKLGIGALILILGIVFGIVKWFELKKQKRRG
ncbi:protoglobin domain-containing protein [Desulfurobacterium thermolithotrophum]|uniref:protoglobin domain-containing protein n=1 Tax=Desulfurobacterium thermolithotrophum TaxID=64160 RepID=UPI0013D788F7|nr:protoglobin domain-containing protein [Desulfurobacterium thermolithotrophum]